MVYAFDVRADRKKLGLSLATAAHAIGVTKNHLKLVELGAKTLTGEPAQKLSDLVTGAHKERMGTFTITTGY